MAPGLLIGAYPQDAGDVRALADVGVTHVLNLVEDGEYGDGARVVTEGALGDAKLVEVRIGFEDFGTLDPEPLECAVQQALAWLGQGHDVYVHCRAGRQRSATVAAGTMALRDRMSLLEALRQIGMARRHAEPLAHQREALAVWWRWRSGAERG